MERNVQQQDLFIEHFKIQKNGHKVLYSRTIHT